MVAYVIAVLFMEKLKYLQTQLKIFFLFFTENNAYFMSVISLNGNTDKMSNFFKIIKYIQMLSGDFVISM